MFGFIGTVFGIAFLAWLLLAIAERSWPVVPIAAFGTFVALAYVLGLEVSIGGLVTFWPVWLVAAALLALAKAKWWVSVAIAFIATWVMFAALSGNVSHVGYGSNTHGNVGGDEPRPPARTSAPKATVLPSTMSGAK